MIGANRIFLAAALVLGLAVPASVAHAMGSGSSGTSSTSSPGTAGSSATDYAMAEKAVKAEDYKTAIGLLEKVVAADPGNANALNYLGYSSRKLGDKNKALAYYKKALEIDPKHLGANEYLGELYLEMENLAAAEERLAVLAMACKSTCEEFQELAEQVRAYKAKHQG
ncbi:MAG: tetratricopeptide repeat protein [Alphaproteobacteria bacterium]